MVHRCLLAHLHTSQSRCVLCTKINVTRHAKMRRFSKIMVGLLLDIWIEQIQTEIMIPQFYL